MSVSMGPGAEAAWGPGPQLENKSMVHKNWQSECIKIENKI